MKPNKMVDSYCFSLEITVQTAEGAAKHVRLHESIDRRPGEQLLGPCSDCHNSAIDWFVHLTIKKIAEKWC